MKKKIIISLMIVMLLVLVLGLIIIKGHNNEIRFITSIKDNETILKIKGPYNYKIYYTVDGSLPDENSILYEYKIVLNDELTPDFITNESSNELMLGYPIKDNDTLPKGTIIRAIGINPKGKKTKIINKTFFTNINLKEEFKDIAVMSLVTDPKNMLDYKTGIMVKGEIYDKWYDRTNGEDYNIEANFTQKGKKWERDVYIDYYYNSNEPLWSKDAKIRIKGGISRYETQKSFNIYFRDEKLNYELFDKAKDLNNNTISNYSSITLRNGGNHANALKYKDTLLQSLVKDRNVDIQNTRPVIVFINGQYFGIYNLEEKYSSSYYANHYGLKEDNIIIIKEDKVEDGKNEDINLYNELLSYSKKDLSNSKIYEEFLSIVDINSMLDYYAIQIYIGNIDWGLIDSLHKNTLLWRTRDKENDKYGDQKWRWGLYDLEYSSNTYGRENTKPDFCSIKNALEKDELFDSLMKNKDFNKKFYEVLNMIKNNYKPDIVKEMLNKYDSIWNKYMVDYFKRYSGNMDQYNEEKDLIIEYFEERYNNNYC